jgi:hypothetical protein
VLLKIPGSEINELLAVTVDVRQVLEVLGIVFEWYEADESGHLLDRICLVVHLGWLEGLEVARKVDRLAFKVLRPEFDVPRPEELIRLKIFELANSVEEKIC